jgi:heat shock protein HslJ
VLLSNSSIAYSKAMRLLATIAVLILASCTSTKIQKVPPPPVAAKPPDLAGAAFTLSAITVRGKEIPLPATRRPTMQFTETNRVSGLAGVNRYSGEATLTGNDGIAFGPMIATKMAGPPDAMLLESNFLDALGSVARIEYRAGILKLSTADGATRLELTR